MSTVRPWIRFACVLLVTTLAQRAMAQDALSAARAELDAARFTDAVRLYDDAASAASGLDRALLVRLLRERALARGALRDVDGARGDLLALFSLEPGVQLGSEAPPSLLRLAEEVRATVGRPLELSAEAVPVEGGYEVRARVAGDPASIVRQVRVLAIGAGGVAPHAGPVARIPADGELRYVVEAVSFGGAVVATVGTPTAPRVVGVRSDLVGLPPVASSDESGTWIALGVGAGVVAAAIAVTLALVLTLTDGNTRLGFPMELP